MEANGEVAGNLLFQMLDDAAREKVLALAQVQTFSAGTVIIKQGAVDQDIFLIRKGTVSVETTQEGFVVELNTLGPGTLFGEVSAVTNVRRTATVVAVDEVEVLRFPGPELVEELRKHPTAGKLLEHIVIRRAQDTAEKTFGN
jgi:CRP-like cAMP-binding protein